MTVGGSWDMGGGCTCGSAPSAVAHLPGCATWDAHRISEVETDRVAALEKAVARALAVLNDPEALEPVFGDVRSILRAALATDYQRLAGSAPAMAEGSDVTDSKDLRVPAMSERPDKSPAPRALDSGHRCLDIERLAEALDAPGVFEDPLDDADLMGLAEDIIREYEALP